MLPVSHPEYRPEYHRFWSNNLPKKEKHFCSKALDEAWIYRPKLAALCAAASISARASQPTKDLVKSKSDMLFRHLRCVESGATYYSNGISNKGGMTVGLVIDRANNRLELYHAVCADTDTFNKNIGRHIAECRAMRNEGVWIPYDKSMTLLQHILWWVDFEECDLIDQNLSKECKQLILSLANRRSNYA